MNVWFLPQGGGESWTLSACGEEGRQASQFTKPESSRKIQEWEGPGTSKAGARSGAEGTDWLKKLYEDQLDTQVSSQASQSQVFLMEDKKFTLEKLKQTRSRLGHTRHSGREGPGTLLKRRKWSKNLNTKDSSHPLSLRILAAKRNSLRYGRSRAPHRWLVPI